MSELVDKHTDESVWYSPIVYKDKQRLKTNAVSVGFAAADADACEPQNFRLAPSMVVETSPNRFHVYWKLNESADANDIAKINRRIAQVHKDEGCDTAFVNAAKLLRVPGTSNHKHPGAVVLLADWDADVRYANSEIESAYPSDEVADAIDVDDTTMPDGLEDFVLNQDHTALKFSLPNTISLREMLFGEYHPDKRSEVLFKLCVELYDLGLSDQEVTALAWGAPSNKFRTDDARGLRGLWETAVVHARALFQDSGGEGGEQKREYKELNIEEASDFLSLDEREFLKGQITFIDEWTTWANGKTDAPSEYHQAAAIVILSTIYSQFAYVYPQFGKLKLNLWVIMLGRTTKDRKSTAMGYVQKLIRALQSDDYSYIIPDDSTPGGLNLALSSRANKSSLLSRDEVQGFFQEMMSQSYMAGGISYFTKLYDGWSGGRARASGDKKEVQSVPISLVLYMGGILEDSAAALTISNYKQGFLTRFLYVIAERPENYEQPPLEFPDVQGENDDPVFNSFVTRFIKNRTNWAMKSNDGEEQVLLKLTPEAVTRFQQFQSDVNAAAAESRYAEVIESTSERMTLSVLKLAGLFAMDERSNSVTYTHILQAIRYAGKWFDNSQRVASMIARSDWDREVDRLEEFINSKGGEVTYFQAYRHFGGRQKDFEEIISGLSARGVLLRERAGRGWKLKTQYKDD